MSLLQAFQDVAADLNTVLVERESAVENALLALVTGEHYLQLGPRGTAKSLLVDALCARITGAAQFKILLNQATTPDEVFGPVDLIELADHGRYTRRRQGSITESHVAWCDEIYKCNSVVLNGLLKIVNERELSEIGMGTQQVPLISLFAASNETPTDDGLLAFDDRLIVRELIQEVVDDESFVRMLTAKEQPPRAFLSLDQIYAAQQEVCAVKGTREVLDLIVALRHGCSQEGISVSPRRWKKALKIAKARAWLEGCPEVDVEHLLCLTHVLWCDPKDRKTCERLVYAAASPLYLTALEAEDSAEDLVKQLPKEDSSDWDAASENCLLQISDIHKHLARQISRSSAKNQAKAQVSLAKIAALHTQVSRSLLKRLERLQLASAK